MKRLNRTLVLGLTLAALPMAAFATATPVATATPTSTVASTPTVVTSNLPSPTPAAGTVAKADQAAHLAILKTKGTAEINRRIISLQSSLTDLSATTKLSAADKATLTTQVQTEITGLQALATKLNADTTLAAAHTDVTSIFNDFRVYALMLPKVRLVAVADQFATVGANFNILANNLQTKLGIAKAQGKDTTAAEASLADLELKLDDAHSKYTGLADKVIALAPSDYNGNHTVLSSERDSLVLARADFKAARADVDTIVKDIGGKVTTPSPSASPSPSPIVSPQK